MALNRNASATAWIMVKYFTRESWIQVTTGSTTMADPDRKLKDLLSAIERVRKSLNGTQAHVPSDTAAYAWSQIGQAVRDLEKIERQVEEIRRDVQDSE
jgi:hypothetical protein